MAGHNRFSASASAPLGKGGSLKAQPQVPCIFISHKQEDGEMARRVAGHLMEMGVDVWLDSIHMPSSTPPKSRQDHQRLTEAVETALQSSTHLLALITPAAQTSWWVPFEIGSCRALQRGLAFLIHKDVSPPSYVVVGTSLTTQQTLLDWAARLIEKEGSISLKAIYQARRAQNLDPYVRT